MTRRTAGLLALLVLVSVVLTLPALAQRSRRVGFGFSPAAAALVAYAGRFVIVRLWYANHPGWSFDYPDMEHNLGLIFRDMTALRIRPDGSNVFRMDDPELHSSRGWYAVDPTNEAFKFGVNYFIYGLTR